MIEHGELWQDGNLFAKVEVEFRPHRWMGSVTYKGKHDVDWGGEYLLKMDDGMSAEIRMDPGLRSSDGTCKATFNPAKPPKATL
jgi:hypothetical protein